MSSLAVLRGVDAVTVPVPDLDQGLQFYRDQLGHQLAWRNDAVGQVGLRSPESQAELVLSTKPRIRGELAGDVGAGGR